MIDIFFDKKCSIYSIWYSKVDGTQVPSRTLIHELIPCDFGKWVTPQNFTNEPQITKASDIETMEIVINWPSIIDIRKGMEIELYENVSWVNILTWNYVINTVDYVKNINWYLDNIYMSATTTDD